jgi:hypothetical protein
LGNLRLDPLAGQSERDKHDKIAQFADAFAPEGEVDNLQLDAVPDLGERASTRFNGAERSRWNHFNNINAEK